MLPHNPKRQQNVSQLDKPMLNSTDKVVSDNSIQKFAKKATSKSVSLIIKNPFWVLVIGSLGIHAAFAIIAPSPLKKTEPPREAVISTLPVVKLPAKPLTPSSKQNKSIFDNLFVKPSVNQPNSSSNSLLNLSPNTTPNTSLRSFDLSNLDRLEDSPPLATNLPLEVPPLTNNSANNSPNFDPPQFVKPQTRVSQTQPLEPSASRFTPSGQIDNSSPKAAVSNLKPEIQSGRNEPNLLPIEPKNVKPSGANSKTVQEVSLSNLFKIYPNVKDIDSNSSPNQPYQEDIVVKLYANSALINTVIAHPDVSVSAINTSREKEIVWVPARVANASGKKGTVIIRWLVAPNGEVAKIYFTSSKDRDLDDSVIEAVKGYQFKSNDDSQGKKYRLVSATYEFPSKY
jgi:TonB family protein